ncbi:MAG: hypothetical protein ACR2HM_10850 [Acidimicrobiales bacterium]
MNAKLYEAGYGPVASRSFAHYRRLLEAGYRRYISINRFDVAHAATPFEGASANGRYDYRAADLGVNVIFAKSSRLFEASGRATEIGDVGAILQFSEPEVIDGLGKVKPQPGDMVTVRYLEAGRTVGGRVIEADLKSSPALVEVEYARLLSIADVGVGVPLDVTVVRFVLQGPDDQIQTLDLVGRRLYLFFEVIEGLRALSNDASARQPHPAYAPPPVLRRLSVASPADVLIELVPQIKAMMPLALVAVVLKGAWEFPSKRKEWLEGSGLAKQNTLLDLEVELKEIEVQRKQKEAELRSEMIGRARVAFPESEITDEEATQAIDGFVLPPLRALGRIGVIKLHTEDSDGDPQQPPGANEAEPSGSDENRPLPRAADGPHQSERPEPNPPTC